MTYSFERDERRRAVLLRMLIDFCENEQEARLYHREIIRAARCCQVFKLWGLRNGKRINNFKKMVHLLDRLDEEIKKEIHWMELNLGEWVGNTYLSVGITLFGENNPFYKFRTLLTREIERGPEIQGSEEIYFRKIYWSWLALIYEEASGKRAATAKNKAGQICGRFAKFVYVASLFSRRCLEGKSGHD